ncbi:MAG: hypothetical protein ACYDAY_00010 [Candidatus Dormibacteria bacterium]
MGSFIRRVGWSGLGAWSLVAAAVTFKLISIQSEVTRVSDLNDATFHMSMVRWAQRELLAHRLPLDGWYPYLGLGSPNFHHYQSLPHLLTAAVSLLTGVDAAYRWSLYLGLALWPLSVYWCARLIGLGRWPAGAAALVSPFLVSTPGYGYEDASYLWRGYGLWTQLWGAWTLPLAIGFAWRAVTRGGLNLALAAIFTALTVAFHFITGYLALLTIGVWALVAPGRLGARLLRATACGLGAVLVAAWAIVPLVQDSKWAAQYEAFQHAFWSDSFGAGQVLAWLFTGQIFDSGRLPVVSGLVLAGLLMCLAGVRRDPARRAVLAFSIVSLCLYFGPATFGMVFDLLPGHADIWFHRYINGVHLGGLLLAGIGTEGVFLVLRDRALPPLLRLAWTVRPDRRTLAGISAALILLCLTPVWLSTWNFDAQDASDIAYQVNADGAQLPALDQLLAEVAHFGDGRAYAGALNNWGVNYRVGLVPMSAELLEHDLDAVGRTQHTFSLSAEVERRFDDLNPFDYELFNVRYLILASNLQSPVAADRVDTRGGNSLWRVHTSGYIGVADTINPEITADRTDIGKQTAAVLQRPPYSRLILPTIAFGGDAPAPATVTTTFVPGSPPGSVDQAFQSPADGVFGATVTLTRRAAIVLKSTMDPRWEVDLDGIPAEPQMVSPSFVSVTAGAGRHTVLFHYVRYPEYRVLLAGGAGALVALMVIPILARRLPGN